MAQSSWNYGDILDAVASAVPQDAPALIHGERIIAWGDFDRRGNRLARVLVARGAGPGDKVAIYTRNRPEYTEALAACFKARLVHVNVNYRYRAEEIFYILDNSDAQAVLFQDEFAPVIEQLRPRLPKVGSWVQIGQPPHQGDTLHYDDLVAQGDGSKLDIARSPDDQFFIYTGGTTGMPKAVMWQVGDLRAAQLQAPSVPYRPTDMADHARMVRQMPVRPRYIPACPLMHGTGLLTAIATMVNGGCVITLEGGSFDAEELWRTVTRTRATQMAIVGDVFAKPMLDALRKQPGRYDPSSVLQIVSSGVMWSEEVKRGLIEFMPQVTLLDSFGASEGLGFGLAMMTKDNVWHTARFAIGPDVKVFDEHDREVAPGSDTPGLIARGGPIPIGYYKDEAKSARTFRTIDGRRWSIPGDWCRVEADGSVTLLGRGSQCINSGGEKIYPEEVEEVLKTHPDVEDVLVLGVPDERWGQAVTAVVRPRADSHPSEDALRQLVRTTLAPYKAPKRVVFADRAFRSPAGKADYKEAGAFARKSLGLG